MVRRFAGVWLACLLCTGSAVAEQAGGPIVAPDEGGARAGSVQALRAAAVDEIEVHLDEADWAQGGPALAVDVPDGVDSQALPVDRMNFYIVGPAGEPTDAWPER